jgi:hypothetical protein
MGSWEFWDSEPAYPAKDEFGTGQLVLQVEGYSDNLRRRWADGTSQTLEKVFAGIVIGFEALLAARKAGRLEREERQRQQAILAQRQHLAQQRREREKKRKELLKRLMTETAEAERIRLWLQTLPPDQSEVDEFSRFVDWARARLAILESALSRDSVIKVARAESLFPEEDGLHAPLGEPPRPYYYGAPTED